MPHVVGELSATLNPVVLSVRPTQRISRVVLSTAKHHVGLHALVSIASQRSLTLMFLEFFKWNWLLLLQFSDYLESFLIWVKWFHHEIGDVNEFKP